MMNYKSICIVGVDGTGKSTVVEEIKKIYPAGEAVVQYMGMRRFETKFAKICFDEHSHFLLKKLNPIGMTIEQYYRILKHNNANQIVVFDRYSDEIFLYYKNRKKTFKNTLLLVYFWLFLFVLFPKPSITFYLICDIETSIRRKDDIVTDEDIDILRTSKSILDNYYCLKKDVVIIDTTNLSINETISTIREELCKKGLVNT